MLYAQTQTVKKMPQVWLVLMIASQAVAQSTMRLVQLRQNGRFVYATENVLVNIPATPVTFAVAFNPSAASKASFITIPTRVTLTIPNAQFNGLFEVGPSNEIALVHMAEKGIAVCKGAVYFGTVPSPCASTAFIGVTCTLDACTYPATVDDVAVSITADPHAVISCDAVATLDADGTIVRVCTQDGKFNPFQSGATVYYLGRTHQTIFFPPAPEDTKVEALFVVLVVLLLVLWTDNMHDFVYDEKSPFGPNRLQVMSVAVPDVAASVTVASAFAIMLTSESYIPTESVLATNAAGVVWVRAYIASCFLGVALSTAFALVRANANASAYIGQIARAPLETILMVVIHFHLPNTMGPVFRRTVGIFLGIAIACIVARDIPPNLGKLPWASRAPVIAWTVVSSAYVAVIMVVPVLYDSSGITNEAVLPTSAAVLLAAGSATFRYIHL